MAKPGIAYPQVEPSAAALMDRRVVTCPAGRRVAAALDAARQAGAEVLLVGRRRAVRRRELERLCRWGLTGLRAAEVGWDGLPVVPATAPELRARRLLMDGAPMILVRDGRRVVGVIDAEAVEVARPALSLMHHLDRLGDSLASAGGAPAPRRPAARVSGSLASAGGAPAPRRPAARTATESRSGEARLWLLRVAGKVGEGLGTPVFAVGGFVRDLLLEIPAPDVDLLVEGDGVAFARQLCEELGGSLVIHDDFATAAVEGTAGPGGTALGRCGEILMDDQAPAELLAELAREGHAVALHQEVHVRRGDLEQKIANEAAHGEDRGAQSFANLAGHAEQPEPGLSRSRLRRSASRRTSWGWGPTGRGERSGNPSRRTSWGWGPTVRGERSGNPSRRTSWGWGPTGRGERSGNPSRRTSWGWGPTGRGERSG